MKNADKIHQFNDDNAGQYVANCFMRLAGKWTNATALKAALEDALSCINTLEENSIKQRRMIDRLFAEKEHLSGYKAIAENLSEAVKNCARAE